MRGVCNMLHVPGRLDARRGDRRSDRDTRVGACDLRYGYGGPVGRASVAARPARAVAVSHTATTRSRSGFGGLPLTYACVHVEKTPPLHAALPRPNSLAKSYTSLRRTRNTGKPSPKT